MTSYHDLAKAATRGSLSENSFRLLYEMALIRNDGKAATELAAETSFTISAAAHDWVFSEPRLPALAINNPSSLNRAPLKRLSPSAFTAFSLALAPLIQELGKQMKLGAGMEDGGNWYHARIIVDLLNALADFEAHDQFPEFKETILGHLGSLDALMLSLELSRESTEEVLAEIFHLSDTPVAWAKQLFAEIDYEDESQIQLVNLLLMIPALNFESVGPIPWSAFKHLRNTVASRWAILSLEYAAAHLPNEEAKEAFSTLCHDWTGTLEELVNASCTV